LLIAAALPFLQYTPAPTVILCVLIGVLWIAYLNKALCGRRDFFIDSCDVAVLLFCITIAIGAIGNGSPADALSLSLLSSVYFPARRLLSSSRWLGRFRASLLISSFLCSVCGILQYFLHNAELKWVDTSRFSDIGGRVTGTFSNPNILSVYLLLCFPIAVCGMLAHGERWTRRIFFGVTAATLALCTVLTWTRGAWLGLIVEVALILLFYSRRTLAAALVLLPFGVCAVPFLPHSVLNRFSSIGTLSESSIRYRLYTWQGVRRAIAAHPWGIGVGEKAFCAVYPRYALSGIESVMHAHSIYLQLALEIGWAGLAVFLAATLLILLRGVLRGNRFGSVYAISGVLIMGFFDHLWYCRAMIALFFLLAGAEISAEDGHLPGGRHSLAATAIITEG
ncbi:MAG: O-antigen ligase family protein, partial [Clostridia bacterium]|nr:O-antigen ligase family protein [Clostridia bacterium]